MAAGGTKHVLLFAVGAQGPLTPLDGRSMSYINALQQLGGQWDVIALVSDSGPFADLFVASIWMRYLELCGETVSIPDSAFHGDYIFDFAATVHRRYEGALQRPWQQAWSALSASDLGQLVRRQLDPEEFALIAAIGREALLTDMQRQFKDFSDMALDWCYQSDLAQESVAVCAARLSSLKLLQNRGDEKWICVPGHKELLFQKGQQVSATGFYIVVCDNQILKGNTKATLVLQQQEEVALIEAALQALQSAQVQTLGPVQLWESGEPVPADIRDEYAITLRELRQVHGDDLLKLQYLLVNNHAAVELQADRVSPEALQSHQWLQALSTQSFDGDTIADAVAAGMNIESDLCEQWQVLLSQWEELREHSLQALEPAIVLRHLCQLAKFVQTHYNALLRLCTTEEYRRLIQNSRLQLQQGMAMLGF